jgi:DNA polymerase III alpha subunit
MARFRLEDLRGSVDVTCFPRTFDENRERIEDGNVVVCRGKLEDSDEPALMLEQILTVDEALARFEGGIVVHLSEDDAVFLPELQEIVQRHRGSRPLYLQVAGGDGRTRRVRAGGNFGVAISAQFANDVDRVLGNGRVRLAKM